MLLDLLLCVVGLPLLEPKFPFPLVNKGLKSPCRVYLCGLAELAGLATAIKTQSSIVDSALSLSRNKQISKSMRGSCVLNLQKKTSRRTAAAVQTHCPGLCQAIKRSTDACTFCFPAVGRAPVQPVDGVVVTNSTAPLFVWVLVCRPKATAVYQHARHVTTTAHTYSSRCTVSRALPIGYSVSCATFDFRTTSGTILFQQDRSRRRKRGGVTEADEDAAFAAEMLGLVYDRVKDVGDVLRVVGDTAGGLAGGSFKLLSASVNVREWCQQTLRFTRTRCVHTRCIRVLTACMDEICLPGCKCATDCSFVGFLSMTEKLLLVSIGAACSASAAIFCVFSTYRT